MALEIIHIGIPGTAIEGSGYIFLNGIGFFLFGFVVTDYRVMNFVI